MPSAFARPSGGTSLGRARPFRWAAHDRGDRAAWPAAGFVDTEIGCFMKPEVADAETEVQSRVQGRGGSARS